MTDRSATNAPATGHKKESPRGANPEANHSSATIEKPSTQPTVKQPKRPEVLDDSDIHVNADICEVELAKDPLVFSRDGALGRLVAMPRTGLRWRPFGSTSLREAIGRRVRFFRHGRKDERRYLAPPELAASALLERGAWVHVRPLERVLNTPFVRTDGTVCAKPGYDAQSHTFCDFGPDDFPPIPPKPTQEHAKKALASLAQVLVDFPFQSEADRYVPIAVVLSVLAREAIGGCVPFVMISSNVRGTGKSKLASVAAVLAQGSVAAARRVPTTDEEWDKDLLSVAIGRQPLTLYDNVKLGMPFGSSSLDAAMTAEILEGRMLGKNETVTLPLRTVFLGSANNPSYSEDLERRVLPCRMLSPLEQPEHRTGFAIPDIIGHVTKHRARLLTDALTLLSAYVAAGRPYAGKEVGSFENWCKLIAGAIVWSGGPDILETRAGLGRQDEALGALAAIHRACVELGTFTARDAIQHLKQSLAGRDVLESFYPVQRGQEHSQKGLARRINAALNRRVDGLYFTECGKHPVQRSDMWKVATAPA